jgi:hypothetical protein
MLSDSEWKQLEKELELSMTKEKADAMVWRGTDHGMQMKTSKGCKNNGRGTN